LLDYVINSTSIGIFENRLDLFWKSQEYYYDYKSDLAGTGSRNQLYCFTFLLSFCSILTFIDAKIEAVPDFVILRFVSFRFV